MLPNRILPTLARLAKRVAAVFRWTPLKSEPLLSEEPVGLDSAMAARESEQEGFKEPSPSPLHSTSDGDPKSDGNPNPGSTQNPSLTSSIARASAAPAPGLSISLPVSTQPNSTDSREEHVTRLEQLLSEPWERVETQLETRGVDGPCAGVAREIQAQVKAVVTQERIRAYVAGGGAVASRIQITALVGDLGLRKGIEFSRALSAGVLLSGGDDTRAQNVLEKSRDRGWIK